MRKKCRFYSLTNGEFGRIRKSSSWKGKGRFYSMSHHQPTDDKTGLLINPYYFILLFCALVGLNVYYFIDVTSSWGFGSLFFFIHAIGQSLLEVLLFAFASHVIHKYLHRVFYLTFISLCSVLVFIHYIDYLLVRFLDQSFVGYARIIFRESMENFIEVLHLAGIPLGIWALIGFVGLLLIPSLTLLVHGATAKLAKRYPLRLSFDKGLKCLIILPVSLLLLNVSCGSFIKQKDFRYFERFLPWKATFLPFEKEILTLQGKLKGSSSEKEALKQLHSAPLAPLKKPNIYLFIAESLREDFLNGDTSPNVVDFREENGKLKQTLSNANCTQLSWYSIFHSCYPLNWAERKKSWKSGSLPLQALKKMGYKIHVYSAAQLKYYGVGNLIFGDRHHLADSYHVHPHYAPVSAADADQKSLDQLVFDHEKKWARSGNVFIVFVDSTHFNYSWPKEMPLRFAPISEEKTDLQISNSIKDIELIKNRYCNAIYFVDSLFGKLLKCLKEKKLYDEAVMVFTADHGEEFLEQGQLFHASHLSPMQTAAPIYYKLGSKKLPKERLETLTSHVDIFPTILDFLVGEQPFFSFFDGQSLFKEFRFPFCIGARHNGGGNPQEFFIHRGKERLIVKYVEEKRKKKSTLLEILGLRNRFEEEHTRPTFKEKEAYIHAHYGRAFRRLFK